MSEYVTAETTTTGGIAGGNDTNDKILQLGFITTTTSAFNATYSLISARIYGNNTVEFQSNNERQRRVRRHRSRLGNINTGDWLQLIFTTQETASGSFTGTFSVLDYGPTGSISRQPSCRRFVQR